MGHTQGRERAMIETKERTVTITPVARIPTKKCVYTPSRLSQPKTVSYKLFLTRYADNPRPIWVSFEADGKSDPQLVTAYGFSWDCWYIVTGICGQTLDEVT